TFKMRACRGNIYQSPSQQSSAVVRIAVPIVHDFAVLCMLWQRFVVPSLCWWSRFFAHGRICMKRLLVSWLNHKREGKAKSASLTRNARTFNPDVSIHCFYKLLTDVEPQSDATNRA